MHDGAVDPLLAELGVCTPEEWPEAPDHVEGLVAALRRNAQERHAVSDTRHLERTS